MRKNIVKYLLSSLSVLTVMSVLIMSGCKPDEVKETQQEVVKALLTAHPWKLKSYTVDGVAGDASTYQNLELTFGDGTWTSTGKGGKIWPAPGGTWSFNDEEGTSIKRNDGTVIAIDKITDSELVLKLTWASSTLETGRNWSLKGEHIFTFGHP